MSENVDIREFAKQIVAETKQGSTRVIDDDGDVDLDALEKFGNAAFEKQPKVKLWKITFGKDDFTVLLNHLRNGNASFAE